MPPFAPARARARGRVLMLAGGLHAALIGALLAEAARRPAVGEGARQAFVFVPVRLPPRDAAPAPLPPPPQATRPLAARPLPKVATITPPAADAPPPPVSAPVSDAAAPDPFALPAPAATPSLAERARRDEVKIARELAVPITPGALAPGRSKDFARAFQGKTFGFTVDRYVSPDGTSMTRQTRGNDVKCYIPEPYRPGIIPRSSERQREVNCAPEGSGWKRH